MDNGDYETEEDSAPEACVSPEGSLLPRRALQRRKTKSGQAAKNIKKWRFESQMEFLKPHLQERGNSREMRNRAEKMRRDKLNSFIGELATLVPLVAGSAKRMDKTSILRLTASHLRLYQTLNGRRWRHMELPKHMNMLILEQLVCDQLGGFLIIVTPTGKVVFVSPTVENLLGHLQTDLMGQSIFNLTAPDDHDRLRLFLNPDAQLERYFNIRLKRAGPRTESPVYEPVRVVGMQNQQYNDSNQETSTNNEMPSSSSSTSSVAGVNNDVLVFFVKVNRPEPIQERLLEATKDEYVTRHLIDGRIINCDQRISLIAGYMTEEVSGLSAFKFMHKDDVRWVIIALRQMYDRRESKGSSCYRLLSRNGQFIYLRTVGFLEIDDEGTVESFVCVNTLVTEKEGTHLINEMKRRYSAIINSQTSAITPAAVTESNDESVEDPAQVEAAIVHLITNLPSPGSDHRSTPSPRIYMNPNESQDCSSTSENSPSKPYYVRMKTATNKRPPSTDSEPNIYKRHKHSPQSSPSPMMSSYSKRPQITEITQQPEQSIYQQDQLLRH